MKYSIYAFLFCLFFSATSNGQWINSSFTFDGQLRSYRTYKPANYNPAVPASLIVVLHGLGGSMEDAAFLNITGIADTANIVLLSPQALNYVSPFGIINAAWNSGIELDIPGSGNYVVNGDVNDVGFINAMMDSAMLQYSIKPERVYVCGASLGGFMTQRLACESAGRLTAVASVMGTYASALPLCNVNKILPVAHFHGTADEVIAYNGDLQFGLLTFPVGISVDSLINKWVVANNCNTSPLQDTWPDNNNDGLFVEHFSYLNDGKSRVELFKVNSGMHQWYTYANTGGEFDYSTEIWKFFNKQYGYDVTHIKDKNQEAQPIVIYPNPAKEKIFVRSAQTFSQAVLIDIYGRVVGTYTDVNQGITTSTLKPGSYILRLDNNKGTSLFTKFIKM